jgi:hypothetical protein
MDPRVVPRKAANVHVFFAMEAVPGSFGDDRRRPSVPRPGTPAQAPSPDPGYAELLSRIEAQEAEIRDLRAQIEKAAPAPSSQSPAPEPACATTPPIRRLPVVVETPADCVCPSADPPPVQYTLDYFCDYDNGFLIRPVDPKRNPFELKVNAWIQFRHHAFDRDVETWTDNAGVTRPVRNRNAWDIERGRLIFSGYALDERLTYFIHLDGDTDGGEAVDFFDYWWAWEFSDRFQVQFGKRKVAASRQWLLSARNTRFVDRPMANDFFRPDRTVGVFGIGRLGDNGHYEVMVGNGYRTANLPPSETDNRFAFAATNYWDPLGDFGRQIVDYESTRDPLIRLGHSFVYASQERIVDGVTVVEPGFLRLSDGTQLTAVGALAPGVTVSQYDIYFYGIDAAAKWQGWSVNAEAFFQWLEDIRGDGPLPTTDLFQRGFYVEGGRFLVPQKLDINFRYSQVSGVFGNASEIAAGLNWFPLESSNMKISFDVTSLDGSPLQNTTSDILVGDDGVLFRTQFQAEF